MRAQFVRGKDSKDSLNIGNKFLEKSIRIEYELTDKLANKDELKEAGLNILSDLSKIDSEIKNNGNNLYEDEITENHYYGVINALIHTSLSNDEIQEILIENNPYRKLLSIIISKDEA